MHPDVRPNKDSSLVRSSRAQPSRRRGFQEISGKQKRGQPFFLRGRELPCGAFSRHRTQGIFEKNISEPRFIFASKLRPKSAWGEAFYDVCDLQVSQYQQKLASNSHNPEVVGSNPTPATTPLFSERSPTHEKAAIIFFAQR
jgi:hypothetical protein